MFRAGEKGCALVDPSTGVLEACSVIRGLCERPKPRLLFDDHGPRYAGGSPGMHPLAVLRRLRDGAIVTLTADGTILVRDPA